MDTNELIAQNQNTIEGKEGIVAGEVVGKAALENIREIDEEGQNDVGEKDNIVIGREIRNKTLSYGGGVPSNVLYYSTVFE